MRFLYAYALLQVAMFALFCKVLLFEKVFYFCSHSQYCWPSQFFYVASLGEGGCCIYIHMFRFAISLFPILPLILVPKRSLIEFCQSSIVSIDLTSHPPITYCTWIQRLFAIIAKHAYPNFVCAVFVLLRLPWYVRWLFLCSHTVVLHIWFAWSFSAALKSGPAFHFSSNMGLVFQFTQCDVLLNMYLVCILSFSLCAYLTQRRSV